MLYGGTTLALPLSAVALASTSFGGWALWALRAAGRASQDHRVREVVHEVGNRSVGAVRDAGDAAASWAYEMDTTSSSMCLGPWQAALIVIIVVFVVVGFAVATLCGCVLVGGGGWWFGRARQDSITLPAHLRELQTLDALARQAIAGGPGAQRLAALEAGVDLQSMQDWCELWVRAMRGPRRIA